MNKKGFTLIELLAIIVILAIIAVITVPIILNIIENARQGAAKNSVIGYGKSVELAYTQYQYDESLGSVSEATGDVNKGTLITLNVVGGTNVNLHVDFDGDSVKCDTLTMTDGKLALTGCKVNGKDTPTYWYEGGSAGTEPRSGSSTPAQNSTPSLNESEGE
jgi:type IV pilus assembly protein PilA